MTSPVAQRKVCMLWKSVPVMSLCQFWPNDVFQVISDWALRQKNNNIFCKMVARRVKTRILIRRVKLKTQLRCIMGSVGSIVFWCFIRTKELNVLFSICHASFPTLWKYNGRRVLLKQHELFFDLFCFICHLGKWKHWKLTDILSLYEVFLYSKLLPV